MTFGTLHPCPTPRCARLLKRGEQCPDHPKRDTRPSAFRRGYNDAMYRAWRKAVLERDKQCMMCGAPPQPSDHADHVIPVRSGGARYDVGNGQRLCATCHNSDKQAQDNKLPKVAAATRIERPTPVFA